MDVYQRKKAPSTVSSSTSWNVPTFLGGLPYQSGLEFLNGQLFFSTVPQMDSGAKHEPRLECGLAGNGTVRPDCKAMQRSHFTRAKIAQFHLVHLYTTVEHMYNKYVNVESR